MLLIRWVRERVSRIIEGEIENGQYYWCHKYSDFDQIKGILAEYIVPYEDEDTGEVSDRSSQIKLVAVSDPNVREAFPLYDEEEYELTKIAIVEIEGRTLRYLGHSSIPRREPIANNSLDEDGGIPLIEDF